MDSTLREGMLSAGAVFSGDGDDPADNFGDTRGEYAALTSAAGLADFTRRTQIELAGSDRQSFLHNLCTNDIRNLQVGAGCEAFFCNAQGHTLALAYIFCAPDSLIIETVSGQEAALLTHLDRYLIREKVELFGRSKDWAEWLLAGPAADDLLRRLGAEPPAKLLNHARASIATVDVWLRRVDITQPHGYLVACSRATATNVWQALRNAGARLCGAEAVEMARIEGGTPEFGRDVTSANLPQEVGRDARAINFNKGCYIGQETVARLDALGHVNRTLTGLRFSGSEAPAPGTELAGEGGKTAATVTSATFSLRLGVALTMAYVRRGQNSPGTRFESPLGAAEVVALPV